MLLKLLVGIGAFPVVSHADTLNFTLTEANSTYTWSLPSNHVPPSATLARILRSLTFLLLSNGSSVGASSILEFLPFSGTGATQPGGFAICAATCLVTVHGAQVYSGTEQNPIFAVGTFQLTEFADPPALPLWFSLFLRQVWELPLPYPNQRICFFWERGWLLSKACAVVRYQHHGLNSQYADNRSTCVSRQRPRFYRTPVEPRRGGSPTCHEK
jgi:hypothetical protein